MPSIILHTRKVIIKLLTYCHILSHSLHLSSQINHAEATAAAAAAAAEVTPPPTTITTGSEGSSHKTVSINNSFWTKRGIELSKSSAFQPNSALLLDQSGSLDTGWPSYGLIIVPEFAVYYFVACGNTQTCFPQKLITNAPFEKWTCKN